MYNPSRTDSRAISAHAMARRERQRGMSLIEFTIGTLIGLIAIGGSVAALMASRGASGSVTDISSMQQQASFAMRVLGPQLRQAGTLGVLRSSTAVDATYSFIAFTAASGTSASVSGADGLHGATDTVTAAFQQDKTIGMPHVTALARPLARNCLSDRVAAGTTAQSTFYVDDGKLMCRTDPDYAQPIIANVADFQVRYRIETVSGPGTTASQSMSATDVTTAGLWKNVNAVEVCLDLIGTDPIPDASATYTDCPRSSPSPLLNNRVHRVYRNVFELRKKGPV
jgi:type IV pilus assembly protein PilW